tara:strand:- start:28 stop:336 length:309 start_codon:yes stop_codon:yes gene_type:complete
MAKYTNISAISGIGSGTAVTLITKGGNRSGVIRSITIANHDDTDSNVIKLFLTDDSSDFTIIETTIPPRVSLLLDNDLSFDSSIYSLKIATSTTADTTVIIK